MSDGTTALAQRRHVRAAVWVLLVVLAFAGNSLLSRIGWLVSFLVRDAVYGLPLIGCVLVLLLVFWSPTAFGLRLGSHRKVWWIYLACGVILAAFHLLRWHLLPDGPVARLSAQGWPSSYLLTPFREELLFRGFMYGVLVEVYPSSEASRRWISKPVLVTAILFGLWHWGWIVTDGWVAGLVHVVLMFVVGLVFGIIRRRSGSVLGAFVLHAVGNFVAGL